MERGEKKKRKIIIMMIMTRKFLVRIIRWCGILRVE